jgi:flavin-binding protein dodecin
MFGEFPGWLENAFLDEVRLDVFGHGNQEASNLTAALNGKPVAVSLREAGGRSASRCAAHRAAAPGIYLLFICLRPRRAGESLMSDHVYKKIELVGSSPKSIEEAVENALERARKTIRNMRWFEVAETRGFIEDGKVDHWQVTLKVGFTLDK